MLQIEPIRNINFKSAVQEKGVEEPEKLKENGEKLLTGSITALAIAGLAITGLIKTKPSKFKDALKKAGVEIKNDIAIKIDSQEKFTGKIERFESRNRKEVTEYVNGVITEKVYYNNFGKEIKGTFYKDGLPKYGVGNITRDRGNVYYVTYEYQNGSIISRGDARGKCKGSVFQEYRDLIKNIK